MTKHQTKLLEILRGGGRFSNPVGVWYGPKHHRIRLATQEALEATGELVEIQLKGRIGAWWYVVHRDKVKIAARGQQILQTKELK